MKSALQLLHAELEQCRACPKMIGPVVHGPVVASQILLIGQAPGPHEGKFSKPWAWTAGKTLFKWFEESVGISEDRFRANVYIAAVARCFPGKAASRGDRKPDPAEIAACGRFLKRETEILQPRLILPVGTLAIEQVLGRKAPLIDVVGTMQRVAFHGVEVDAIPLPHPSGVSPWHRMEPGKTALHKALALIAAHPTMREVKMRRTH